VKEVQAKDLHPQRQQLQEQGYALYHYDNGPFHSFPPDAPWLTDHKFSETYKAVRNNTLVDRARCFSHYQLVQQAMKVPGDILEVGVWRGGTAAVLAQTASDRTVYLADTFKGVVKASDWEVYEGGEYADTSSELVINFFKDLHLDNYKILEGVFPEETGHEIEGETLAYVHIDVDVYLSAKDAFNFVWDKLSPGGLVVFDDYGFISHCPGVYRFVNEIKDDADKVFVHNLNGQAYIIKR
jgi:O-methyltransferase